MRIRLLKKIKSQYLASKKKNSSAYSGKDLKKKKHSKQWPLANANGLEWIATHLPVIIPESLRT